MQKQQDALWAHDSSMTSHFNLPSSPIGKISPINWLRS